MAQPLLTEITKVQRRLENLLSAHNELIEKFQGLEEENLRLKAEIKEKEAELLKANTDIEYLKVSHRLADNPDTIIKARRKIAGLIRTIDNCISMLKE